MTLKLRDCWTLKYNALRGITFGDWWKFLKENRFAVDFAFLPRALGMTAMSIVNSYYARKERRMFHDAIAKVEITKPPLFVLGHWRSGTTHLHNLLSMDTEKFAFPNTFQVLIPHAFLCMEKHLPFLKKRAPVKRPQDNMKIGLDLPQEDEFALMLYSMRSAYLGAVFPRNRERYDPYLSFRNASERDIEEWKKAFIWFAKKLTYKYDRALLMKSPAHTARIRLLLEMFPDARFVHIYRNPYVVFQSTLHTFRKLFPYFLLQFPDIARTPKTEAEKDQMVVNHLIDRYNHMYDAFFEDCASIPDNRFVDIKFEELEQDPLGQMHKVYSGLELDDWDAMQAKIEEYISSLKGYRKNKHTELAPAVKEKIAANCQRNFDKWGYSV